MNQIDATPAVAPPVAAAPTTAGPANGTVGCITSGEHEGWIFTCAEDPSTTITLSSAAFQVNEHEGTINSIIGHDGYQTVDVMIDSGSTENVCRVEDFPASSLESSPPKILRSAQGQALK